MRRQSLVIAVPTRNRSDLAITAIQSVIDEEVSGVSVLVSDNSTDADEQAKLSAWCKAVAAAGTRLCYVRPPEPVPMPEHWEWVIEQAFNPSEVTHVLYLTDRMIFRPSAVGRLVALLQRFPERVISYSHDRLDDYHRPAQLEELPWTGRLLDVPSTTLFDLFAAGRLELSMPLPRLLNSVVPRGVVERVRQRFGEVCASGISPDFRFAFRCLHVVDSILYFDRTELVSYALGRSQGANYARGSAGQDAVDFKANLGKHAMNESSPIPALMTVGNSMFSEYCATRLEGHDEKMPPVDLRGYLAYIRREISSIEEPSVRAQMERVIEDNTGQLSKSLSEQRVSRLLRRATLSPSDLIDWLVSLGWLLVPALRRIPSPPAVVRHRNLLPVTATFDSPAQALQYARINRRPVKYGASSFELMLDSRMRPIPVVSLVAN